MAGWKRGRDGSLRELVLARRWVLPAVLLCMALGDGGCRGSNLPEVSYLGESGDWGRIAGEVRGEGILWRAVDGGEREGERPPEEAVLEMCFAEPETMLEPVMQIESMQLIFQANERTLH